jgi:hypothetical protein
MERKGKNIKENAEQEVKNRRAGAMMIVVVIKMTIIIIVTHSMDMSSLQEANSH